MKIIVRVILFAIGLGIAMLALHGCVVENPTPILTVVASPGSGHPPFDIAIAAICSEPDGMYTLTAPREGSVESTDGVFTATVGDWPWRAAITWSDGNSVVERPVVVTLENERPIAHDLTLTPDSILTGQGIWIDLRYLEQGCDNGTPKRISGIEDPDWSQGEDSGKNDGFTYHVEVYDQTTGQRETVFKPDAVALGKDEYTDSPYFKWFVDWVQLIAPYPFAPRECCPDPEPEPDLDIPTHNKLINVYVCEFGSVYHWVYTISAGVIGCSSQ